MNHSEESNSNAAAVVSGTWTQYLPEALGIRDMFESTPFRWCARESLLWGIATGTTMGLHRLRMESRPRFAFNVAFLTFNLVCIPSYYFCYRKREHKEQMIEMMMKANDFAPLQEMPPSVPLTDHPFLMPADHGEIQDHHNQDMTTGTDKGQARKPMEYRAWLKEWKEWQRPKQENHRDMATIFQPSPQDPNKDT